MNSLLNTKIQIPKSFGRLVERPRLFTLLDASLAYPATLLAAPAGFGKTTLISQWLSRAQASRTIVVRAAWFSCDELDSAIHVFLSYFISAIRVVSPDAFPETMNLLEGSELLSHQALALSLVNEVDQWDRKQAQSDRTHVVAVLDDYDSIRGSAVNDLIGMLLKYPPSFLHLLFICRRDPTLPLARWRTRNLLYELRSEDLRFTKGETASFLEQTVPVQWQDDQIEALNQKTEGWAAGLRLIAMVAQEQTEVDRLLQELVSPPQHVINYLMEEVLTRLDPETQMNLLRLSVLKRFNAELCEAVCPDMQESGTRFLARIRASNLFLVGLDSNGTWFRFQHLFQELLQFELKQTTSLEERAEIHKRAMNWLAAHDIIEEALVHAFAAGDIDSAADLITRHRHNLMNREQWQRLNSWLEMFSPEILAKYPELLLAKAWVARTLNFDLDATNAYVSRASNALNQSELPARQNSVLRAEIETLIALQTFRVQLNATRMELLTQHALQVLPLECYMVRSYAYLTLATAYQAKGDSTQAIETMRKARREEVALGNELQARAIGGEGIIQWVEGNLPAVLESGNRALTLAKKESLLDTATWGKYLVAAAAYQSNDLDTAETYAAMALNDPNPLSAFRPTVDSMLILALVYQARNMPERAVEILDDALEWVLETHSETLTLNIRAFQAEIALRQGDLATASRWLAAFGVPPIFGGIANFTSPLFTVPKVLMAQGTPARLKQAGEFLAELVAHLKTIHSRRFLVDALALQALWFERQNEQPDALATLQQALTLAESGGLIRPFTDLEEPMEKLLERYAAEPDSNKFTRQVLQSFSKPRPAPPAATDLAEPLTDREISVLRLLAKRYSNKEIAHELIISPLTVKAHTEHIYNKLGVKSRREAVAVGVKLGLVDPPA